LIWDTARKDVTQIINLLCLAPDIQEAILFLPRTVKGRDPIREKNVRPISAEMNWRLQSLLWKSCVCRTWGADTLLLGDRGMRLDRNRCTG
jgi:hypothetical protein